MKQELKRTEDLHAVWKEDMPVFREKTAAFYRGEIGKNEYKGFSGLYGSYAQRDGKASMLRLRMTAGRITRKKLLFVTHAIRTYGVKRLHFTTCQNIQLHDLTGEMAGRIMEEALEADIVTMGGGGDFPRNVMCSPFSGVETGEYFNVLPYAEAAAEYLMQFIKAEKMPRKLKVAFSSSAANLTHATFRDLGFAAREDGRFDVYSAGGLGNHPMLGVLVAEAVEPSQILFYVKAMWLTFLAYGNYQNRGKARTRFMQEKLGGPDAYRAAYLEKLRTVYESGEDLTISVTPYVVQKQGAGKRIRSKRVLPQKQEGLYTVSWHPIGGQPSVRTFCKVAELLVGIPEAEMRLSPDGTAYLINLTETEARTILKATEQGGKTPFECSVSCIGAEICQVGLRDSQRLLRNCILAVKDAGLPAKALPQIHISGCPSSCGTHQIGRIGFRGAARMVNGVSQEAYQLYAEGMEVQGAEQLGNERGVILSRDIPIFLVELGSAVVESGLDYEQWVTENRTAFEEIIEKYT